MLLANGTTKPISEVKVGDKVIATDPRSGRTAAEPVLALIVGKGPHDLVDITIKEHHRSGHLYATAHHPFWNATRGRWTYATDLEVGTRLRLPSGAPAIVSSVARYHRDQHVNNLSVAGLHTYYVVAGTTPVLVNNCGNGVALGQRVSGTREFAEDRGLKHFLDLGPDDWRAPVQRAIADGNVDLAREHEGLHRRLQRDGAERPRPGQWHGPRGNRGRNGLDRKGGVQRSSDLEFGEVLR
ncbi:polymorphic toxin-type HINT domain-containing protein [Actinoallomurus rhizosphaericola]|uniref:polymorphic toxin-type HINT domain-containing protein n=1 Tax=Actinoallomurus rhizosphaericola TaxID=2952536 RepID=UPI0020903BA4|nr:polymorphic toxin-type HINT domain-containing protein [Actinoallomurus rhizosphaericola]MCO5993662.1 HINT domain-containing protein [Actinoallomurus rhizosphaericola]